MKIKKISLKTIDRKGVVKECDLEEVIDNIHIGEKKV
jgi:hypothetical protein